LGLIGGLIIMKKDNSPSEAGLRGGRDFRTTHWSVVLAAAENGPGHSAEALDQLCRTYWGALYLFVRRQGWAPDDAQDLTQAFFAHLLQNHRLARVHPEAGRFRNFLMASAKHFLANEWDKRQRIKRGGSAEVFSLDAKTEEERYLLEPMDKLSPERIFERRWAEAVIEQVVNKMKSDLEEIGQGERFQILQEFLMGERENSSYAEAGARLGMSVSAVTSAIHRLRARFRELFRAEIANTVGDQSEIDSEIRYLFNALAS
jgi:RNA polymerase sigma-70 factor (ECF subfamily)